MPPVREGVPATCHSRNVCCDGHFLTIINPESRFDPPGAAQGLVPIDYSRISFRDGRFPALAGRTAIPQARTPHPNSVWRLPVSVNARAPAAQDNWRSPGLGHRPGDCRFRCPRFFSGPPTTGAGYEKPWETIFRASARRRQYRDCPPVSRLALTTRAPPATSLEPSRDGPDRRTVREILLRFIRNAQSQS
jgi:hypothetical protein